MYFNIYNSDDILNLDFILWTLYDFVYIAAIIGSQRKNILTYLLYSHHNTFIIIIK